MVIYMSVIESVIQKFINSSIRTSYGQSLAITGLRTRSRLYCDDRNLGVTGGKDKHCEQSCQDHSENLAASGRDVHLKGFDKHEDVVRAYLEFSGIDPDSKEGQFYFDL